MHINRIKSIWLVNTRHLHWSISTWQDPWYEKKIWNKSLVNVVEKRFLKLQKSIHDEGRPGLVLEKPHWAADGRVKHIHWQIVSKDEGREVELFRSIPAQMKEFYPSKVRQIPKNFHSSRLPETTTSLQACLEGRNTFWRDQEGRQTRKAVGQEESSDSSSGRWKFHG